MDIKVTIMSLCSKLQMTRQNYYKARQHKHRKEAEMDIVEKFVREERRVHPRLGGRKVLFLNF